MGIGLSTFGKLVQAVSDEAKVPAQETELLRENERLRKENRILRQEREVFRKAAMFFAAQRPLALDLSRICAAPSARLGDLGFEGQGAFASQC